MKLHKEKYSTPALKGGMLQRVLLAFFVLCCFFSLEGRGNPSSEPGSALLDSANSAYAKADFQKAANLYQDILKMGYEAPEVYYNLGNCYFKLDQVGMSILNYEKAKKISAHDEDLNFNLKLANQRTVDKVEPLPQLFLEEWWEDLIKMHSEKVWGIRSIISFFIFLFFLGVFITSGKVFTKQLGFWLSILFIVFSAFSFFIAKSSYSSAKAHDSAVILSSSAEVKNSPAETGKKLFILHEGTMVSTTQVILSSEGEWVMVQLSPEKAGWVKRASLEFI